MNTHAQTDLTPGNSSPKNLFQEIVVERDIEDGEEWLHKEYRKENVDESKKIFVAVDAGSTQTRLKIVDISENGSKDLDRAAAETFVIPSDYISMRKSKSLAVDSPALYDNMFSSIVNTSGPSDFLSGSFILRGSLADKENTTKETIGSSGTKVMVQNLYYNIIDAIGYACLGFFDEIPSRLEVYMSLALPPQDDTTKNIQFLQKTLNSFRWRHASTKATIDMTFGGILVKTEPEAQAKAQQQFYSIEDLKNQIKLTIEIGGRSIGLDIMRGTKSVPDTQKTLPYGGNWLIDRLQNELLKMTNHNIDRRIVARAIRTGVLVLGNSSSNIQHVVNTLKGEFARRIALDVKREAFDSQTIVSSLTLNLVEIAGRSILEGADGYSLATPLEKELTPFIPNAEFIPLDENLIPLGLLLEGVKYFNLMDSESTNVSEEIGFDDDFDTPFDEVGAAVQEVAVSQESPTSPESVSQGASSEETSPQETISMEDDPQI